MSFVRYHLELEKGRTTVSVDKMLSDLMSIKLGEEMGTIEAHQAVREKLESFLLDDPKRGGYGLASFVRDRAILFVAKNMLVKKYWEAIATEFGED